MENIRSSVLSSSTVPAHEKEGKTQEKALWCSVDINNTLRTNHCQIKWCSGARAPVSGLLNIPRPLHKAAALHEIFMRRPLKAAKEWKHEAREWTRAGPRVFSAPVAMLGFCHGIKTCGSIDLQNGPQTPSSHSQLCCGAAHEQPPLERPSSKRKDDSGLLLGFFFFSFSFHVYSLSQTLTVWVHTTVSHDRGALWRTTSVFELNILWKRALICIDKKKRFSVCEAEYL